MLGNDARVCRRGGPDTVSAVPAGLRVQYRFPRTIVLGYFQPVPSGLKGSGQRTD